MSAKKVIVGLFVGSCQRLSDLIGMEVTSVYPEYGHGRILSAARVRRGNESVVEVTVEVWAKPPQPQQEDKP